MIPIPSNDMIEIDLMYEILPGIFLQHGLHETIREGEGKGPWSSPCPLYSLPPKG